MAPQKRSATPGKARYIFPTDLDNSVHPLFAASKWSNLEPWAYQLCEPVLQLASLIIEHMAQNFWLALKEGKRVPNPKLRGGPATAMGTKRSRDLTQKDRDKVRAMFSRLTNHVDSFCVDDHLPYDGCCRFGCDKHNSAPICIIVFRGRHVYHVVNARDEAARASALFMLAITVLHEAAHAMHDLLRLPNRATPEPFYEEDGLAELGEAFENFLLGGRLERLERGGLMLNPILSRWMADARIKSEPYSMRGMLPTYNTAIAFDQSDMIKLFRKAHWAKLIAKKTNRLYLIVLAAFWEVEIGWVPTCQVHLKEVCGRTGHTRMHCLGGCSDCRIAATNMLKQFRDIGHKGRITRYGYNIW